MTIQPILFSGKIPTAKCKIKDLKQGKFEEATMFEFDCKDLSDLEEINNTKGSWKYKQTILNNMKNTYYSKNVTKDLYSYYAMENKNGEIIGLAQIKKFYPDLILNYIESESEKRYKYVGQNIIGCLGKIALKDKLKRIYIPVVVKEADDFYEQKCGFQKMKKGNSLMLSKFRIKKFIKHLDSILKSEK